MIEFTDVVKCYEQGNKALNGVTMQIDDGESWLALPAPENPPSSSSSPVSSGLPPAP